MKILYGLPSEGMGHATRSKVIIEFLLAEKHDVQIVTSQRAFEFMQTHFPNRVHEIKGFHLAYKNATVSISKTIFKTIKEAPKQLIKNFTQYQSMLKRFVPELVISDFESFSYFLAKANSIPYISIDNMQVMCRTELDINIPKHEKTNELLAKQIVKAKVPGASHYFISSFFFPKIKKANTTFVPPILRQEIINAPTSVGAHIVVYQTSTSQKELIPILNSISHEKFIVYGFNKEELHGNVELNYFSEQGFIKHLASAKAVIANGGYSFISEAIYLQKPICSVPIQNQFEQFVNAGYIQKLNYGRHFQEFTADNIKAFLYDLPSFHAQLQTYKQDGNKTLLHTLRSFLTNLEKEI